MFLQDLFQAFCVLLVISIPIAIVFGLTVKKNTILLNLSRLAVLGVLISCLQASRRPTSSPAPFGCAILCFLLLLFSFTNNQDSLPPPPAPQKSQ